jgi:HEAT repeat protein
LSFWLNRLWYAPNKFDPEAQEAVRQIGTNAIPYLLRLAKPWGSPVKEKASALLPRTFFAKYQTSKSRDRFLAVYGFTLLGSTARPAVPALMNMLNDDDADIRATAARSLGGIGPGAQDAAPALIGRLHDPIQRVWAAAAGALDLIPPTSEEEVPALVHILKGPQKDSKVTVRLMDRLGTFGSRASAAVPAILLYVDEQDADTRVSAAKALGQIDPAAAAKVGTL